MARIMAELVGKVSESVTAFREGKDTGAALRSGERVPSAVGHIQEALATKQLSAREWDIGQLFESCYGRDAREQLRYASPEDVGQFFREAAGAVSTAAFVNINKQYAYSLFLEPYSYPEFVFQQLVPTTAMGDMNVRSLRIPGITNIGRETQRVHEGDAYPKAGVSENFIETPEVEKYGAIIPITKEALLFDRTGQVQDQCSKVGQSMALDREYRAVNALVDIGESDINGYYRYRWGKSNAGLATIATYGDNSGTHNWDNLEASNPFTDYANMNVAWQRLMAQTDPFTGQPIYFQPKHLVVGPSLAFAVPQVLSGVVTVAAGGYPVTGNPARTEFPNPVSSIVGALTPVGTNSMIFQNQNTTASAATTWYLGDIARALGYLEAWAPRVDSLGAGSQDDFNRDIVMQFRVSEMGTYFTKEPRALVKCTA